MKTLKKVAVGASLAFVAVMAYQWGHSERQRGEKFRAPAGVVRGGDRGGQRMVAYRAESHSRRVLPRHRGAGSGRNAGNRLRLRHANAAPQAGRRLHADRAGQR